ncbi:MAG: hypothetical protein AB198_01790 [Parcubacteria bacterium C7867-003]|nr:MAG: hypothetical protein AB198_01790 [Parcubacteria bacterium C7867-003]
MHPEIVSDKPGTCPRCHMDLVPHNSIPKANHVTEDKGLGKLTWKSYMPLIVITLVLILTAATISIYDARMGFFAIEKTISYFMIGFFLTFATFKLMDIKGFAHGYQTYDLLAIKAPWYGYVYPFIELFFGLAMILMPFSRGLLVAEFVVMVFSGVGVAIKIAKKEEFVCACLGTFLKVPLTKVTLIEDFGMAALALLMFLLM